MALCCQLTAKPAILPHSTRFCAKTGPQSFSTDRLRLQPRGTSLKHFLIAGLLAAIGAVALTSVAHAESRYCFDNPDSQRCEEDEDYTPRRRPPPPQPDFDEGYDDPGVIGTRPPRPRPPELGDFQPPRPPGEWGENNRRRYCFRVGQELRDYGYRRVRPIECGGNNFKYTAYRGSQRYLIKIKARTGRIFYQLPY